MNLSAQDIPRLRWSLVFLAVALLIVAALAVVTRQQVAQAEQARRQWLGQQQEIRGRLNHAREEEQDIRNRIERYRHLLDSGLIAQEERLNWVEQITRIKKERRLLDVQYELSPQHPIDEAALPSGAQAGGYEFMASTMKLHMALLHEDDLLGFISDLRQSVHAHLLVRDCVIDRETAAAPTDRGPPAQLRAECSIDWITLREKKS